MKKSFIYILMAMIGIVMTGCSAESSNEIKGGLTTKTPNTEQPKDTTTQKWNNCDAKDLQIIEMIATPHIYWSCTNNQKDTCQMESWLLEIKTADMTIYRNYYQPTIVSGRSLDAQRSTDPETKDKYGNLVTRHYYTQEFEFNNFTHSISGAWTTGRIIYGNGKEESYLPYDGLYYSIENLTGVGDTTQFVRNDSIFAVEKLTIEYKASLHKDPNVLNSWESWKRTATVTVISFIGVIEHEEEIPTANFYVSNLQWHATSGNRLFRKTGENKDGDIGNWEDGFLMSTDTHYIMLIVHYTVDAKDGKSDERYNGTELFSIEKSAMATPVAGREYNGVMYDYNKKQYIPCCLSKDYNFSYGSKYADGSKITFQPDRNGSVMAGVKNFAKDKDASPTPWLEGGCTPTQYKGDKNYYTITLKSSVHTNTTTVADSALKK